MQIGVGLGGCTSFRLWHTILISRDNIPYDALARSLSFNRICTIVSRVIALSLSLSDCMLIYVDLMEGLYWQFMYILQERVVNI